MKFICFVSLVWPKISNVKLFTIKFKKLKPSLVECLLTF